VEPDGRTVYDTGSAFGLNFSANNLNCVFSNATPWGADAQGTMYLEPETPSAKEHGFPVYPHCVLITHRPQPPFVPVSQARVLAARIAEVDKRVANLREAGARDLIAQTKKMLKAQLDWAALAAIVR